MQKRSTCRTSPIELIKVRGGVRTARMYACACWALGRGGEGGLITVRPYGAQGARACCMHAYCRVPGCGACVRCGALGLGGGVELASRHVVCGVRSAGTICGWGSATRLLEEA